MNARRRFVVGVLAWITVVAIGSTVVWAVISRAGGGVAPTAGSGTVTTSSSAAGSRAPTRSPRAHPSPTRASPTRPSPGTSSSATPSSTGSSSTPPPPPRSSSAGSSPTRASDSPAGPSAVRRTWQGPGGLVIAECRGPAISLVSSSADAGFRVEVGSRGPEEVELTFEGQGEEGRETKVKGRCLGGVPDFEVETSDDD